MFLVESDKLDIKRHLMWFSVYHASVEERRKEHKKNENQRVLFDLLLSRMRYDVKIGEVI